MVKKRKINKKYQDLDNMTKQIIKYLKAFWNYLWHDNSFGSYVLNFVVAFIVIKYLLFPFLGLVLGTSYPVVAIVSGSMEHKITNNLVCDKRIVDIDNMNLEFDEWWRLCGDYYEKNYNVSESEFESYDYSYGLNVGDVMVIYGKEPNDIQIGEVLVFVPGDKKFFEEKGPVIHRVVEKDINSDGEWVFRTKGDHNPLSVDGFEDEITENEIIGVAKLRVPFVGYVKIWFVNLVYSIFSIFR